MRLIGDDPNGVRVQDLLKNWKAVFGDVLSRVDAHMIVGEGGADTVDLQLEGEVSHMISAAELATWWSSPKRLAQKYRQMQQEDIKNVQSTVMYFNIEGEPGTTEEKLYNSELAKMVKDINLEDGAHSCHQP